MKKFVLLISLLMLGIASCTNQDVKQKVESKRESVDTIGRSQVRDIDRLHDFACKMLKDSSESSVAIIAGHFLPKGKNNDLVDDSIEHLLHQMVARKGWEIKRSEPPFSFTRRDSLKLVSFGIQIKKEKSFWQFSFKDSICFIIQDAKIPENYNGDTLIRGVFAKYNGLGSALY